MASYNSIYTAMSQGILPTGLLPGPLPATTSFWSTKLQPCLIPPSSLSASLSPSDVLPPVLPCISRDQSITNDTSKKGFSIADILSDEKVSQCKSLAQTRVSPSNTVAKEAGKDRSHQQLSDLSQYLPPGSLSQYGAATQSPLPLPVAIPYLPTAATAAVSHHLQHHGIVAAPISGMRPCRNKRVRTIFTPEQLEQLEKIFQKQQYMVGTERYYLASKLCLSEAQVKVWFQNRRIKWRKQLGLERRVTGDVGSGGVHSCSSDYSDDTCSESGFSDTGSV